LLGAGILGAPEDEMKQFKSGMGGVILVVCFICAGLSVYYARMAAYASAPKAVQLSLDQQLSAISINVTILAGIIAVAALSIGIAALIGWGELRNMLLRKAEDDVLKIIRKLQKDGEITDATASVLAEAIAEDRVFRSPVKSVADSERGGDEISPEPVRSVTLKQYPGREKV
jgi:hypothetical protein